MTSIRNAVRLVASAEAERVQQPQRRQGAGALRRSMVSTVRPIRSWLQPRRFHAYCLGTPKSGTRAVARLFGRAYRARHEPECDRVIGAMLATSEGSIDRAGVRKFVKRHDRRLWLELESSNLLCWFAEILAGEFQDAKFILTIRDCYSWLDACLNHQLTQGISEERPYWLDLRDLYFRPPMFRHAEEERVLAERRLYTLDGYLSLWAAHNHNVLDAIPKDRLLIVRTDAIQHDIARLAAFLDVSARRLDASRGHLYTGERNFNVLREIDRDFLQRKVDLHCGELMRRLFPEVRCLEDTLGPSRPLAREA